ncbi:hypothetical protein SAMN05421812_106325 [Asanoa hainanensis]|uniref:Phosphotransferase enzyme family protein n=1 Tax=Asanoa hainanensis TaxID=560556 RepID=A0A239MTF5_9ACTN|nr:hypothetical protein [Asanoa hainanensis]SNT46021.1 hypothetical protein SAMN05421812_106325 [Asanoa hainanensis]
MTGRTVHGSTTEMIKAVAAGRPVRQEASADPPGDPLFIDGEPFRIERIGRPLDWVMRALGDGADGSLPWTVRMWQGGLLDRLPRSVDHTIVGVAWDPATQIAELLVRDERAPVPHDLDLDAHRAVLDHMAALHKRFWHLTDPVGLAPPGARYTALAPATGIREAGDGADALVVGWAALAADQPEAHEVALSLAVEPAPLLAAFDGLPTTLVNGDWRLGNARPVDAGHTVLLGWGWAGIAGSCVDLAGYLALNAGRLPESKNATIEAFRAALHRHKIDTAGWWDRQLELALLGAFVQLGWSKTTDTTELAWWLDRVLPTARTLPT